MLEINMEATNNTTLRLKLTFFEEYRSCNKGAMH